jgi:hypothetical protein
MLVFFAFPVADLRSFTDAKTHRLRKPTIPAEPGKHFIRDTGLVHARLRGGSQVVAGEDLFCEARHACRLPADHSWTHLRWNGCRLQFQPLLRRYFRTGQATSRFEIGFRATADDVPSCAALPATTLIDALAGLQVRVGEGYDRQHSMALAAAGDALADHFRVATTRHRRRGHPYPTESRWCRAGEPLVVIELADWEQLRLPPYSSSVDAISDPDIKADFFLARIPRRQSPIGCWVLRVGADARMDRARQLRLHLVRVHGEVQCLTRIVQAAQTTISTAPLSAASANLVDHLDKMTRLLKQSTRHGTEQRNILETAYQSHRAARPGELKTLLDAAENLSRDLKQRTEKAQAMARTSQITWLERGVVGATSLFIVGLVGYLVIRNEPIADQNMVVMLRILLSLAVSVLGAVIPGFVHVSWKGSGLAIRAGGALALFVLTFLITPQVLPSSPAGDVGARESQKIELRAGGLAKD